MPLDSSPVASGVASLADLADEAASLFDSVVTLGGSKKEITSCLENLLIHLVETLRAFHNVINKPSAESYPPEAMRAHLNRVSGWLTDLRQTLQRGSSSEAIGNRQNDDTGALGSSSASETATNRDNFPILKQALIPLLNELTLMLHLYHRYGLARFPFQEVSNAKPPV
jgi:hypothetical protein